MEPSDFFKELLNTTADKFEESPVFQKQKKENKNWNYAVCATPIVKNKGVMFGINWGGDNHRPQTEMPNGTGIKDYRFIKQSKHYLSNYWGLDFKSINFNYSNLCFFRTPKANLLTTKDFELSLPLFEMYVRYINPPWLLSIGGTNMKVLDKFGLLKNIKRHFDKQNSFKGHSETLWGYNIFSVPHPSAKLSSESRRIIWDKVTNEMKITNR